MIFKFSRYMLFIGLFVLCSATAFAEGTVLCTGKIMGQTTNQNTNEGVIYFDTHGVPDGGAPEGYEDKYGKLVDVGILDGLTPGTMGIAPADAFPDAACVSEATGTLNYDSDGDMVNDTNFPYEFKLEGYAWNDNLGFINFLGAEAGYEQYAVVVGPEYDSGGGVMKRDLAGYAYSGSAAGPAFGYIQFRGVGNDGAPFNYGVTLDVASGNLSGYAWAEAGMWINFNGVQIELPGEEIIPPVGNICDGVPYLCVDISAYMEADDHWYDIDVYLREGDGVTPLDLLTYDVDADFIWEDTVKLNQLARSYLGPFNSVAEPINSGGAIVKKPISVANSTAFLALFDPVVGDPGHYNLKEKIRSVAPTSVSNISWTTSVSPPAKVPNEFFADELSYGGSVWTDDISKNELILKRVDYEITNGGIPVTSDIVYPRNLGSGYRFEFSPIVDLETLYAGINEDTIVAFRGIPISFTMQESHGEFFDYTNPEVYLVLDYNRTLTASECSDKDHVNFEYNFTGDSFEGLNYIYVSFGGGIWIFSKMGPEEESDAIWLPLSSLSSEQTFNAVATLPTYDPESEDPGLPCDVVQGPTLYSVIRYNTNGKVVYYYGNKVPRIISAAYNPSAIVHGNVYASKAFSTSASIKTQETGYLAVNVVRNTINENIKRYLGKVSLSDGGTCTINSLDSDGNAEVNDCTTAYYKTFKVNEGTANEENVIYFSGSKVTLDMGDPSYADDSKFDGKWVVVVEDGPVFIDSDLYHEDPSNGKLVLISMSTYEGSCDKNNIYLHADVKNIDANIVADCSLFPYHESVAIGADGIPELTIEDKTDLFGKQKLFRGSIASRNTIGGADLDTLDNKEYLLTGTGEVYDLNGITQEERLDAQNYDLNYMAFFMLSVEMAGNGNPIDQRCQKALTIDDMMQINNDPVGHSVYGETNPPVKCDGIDLVQFDPNTLDGDLVVPEANRDNLARGLNPDEDFNPIYIYASSSESFVFEKSGEITSWN